MTRTSFSTFFQSNQVFHFVAGQVEQDSSCGLDFFYKEVGQDGFPIGKHCLVAVFGEFYFSFQPVVLDGIQWAEQSVKERGNAQMSLGIFQFVRCEITYIKVFENDSCVGIDGR